MSSYQEFIDSKHFKSVDAGFAYSTQNSNLFDYQRSCVEWALARGRAALFLDTGLGKTNCELEWAFAVESHTQKPVIILAPLCVSKQIIREAEKFVSDYGSDCGIANVNIGPSGAEIGGAFGGDNFSSAFHKRRGAELFLFKFSIGLAVLFVLSALANILL